MSLNHSNQIIKEPIWYKGQSYINEVIQKFFNQKSSSNAKYSNKQFITEIIKQQKIQADKIIVRQFLNKHSNAQQLNKKATVQQIKSFFQLLKQNYYQIQLKYLNTNLSEQQNNIMNKNKNSIQKFVNDQKQLFNIIILKYLVNTTTNGQEKGIAINKIHQFIYQIILGQQTSKIIAVLKVNQLYITNFNHQHKQQFMEKCKQIIQSYINQTKQQNQNNQNKQFIEQDQILNFLTYWLENNQNNLIIIYARTEKTLNQLKKQYLNKNNKQNKNIIQEKIDVFINSQIGKDKQIDKNQKNLLKNHIFSRYKGQNNQQNPISSQIQSHNSSQLKKSASKSKQQRLQLILEQIFSYACKNRARIHKGTTFDDYLQDGKTMNLQKYMNLFNQLQITNIVVKKEQLIDIFKQNALNRLTLDYKRFKQTVNKILIKSNENSKKQIILKMLNLQNVKIKKKHIKAERQKNQQQKKLFNNNLSNIKVSKNINKIQKSESFSNYNFQLRPVNGMDIQSIQNELKQRKKQKQQRRFLLNMKKQIVYIRNSNSQYQYGTDSSLSNKHLTLMQSNLSEYKQSVMLQKQRKQKKYINLFHNQQNQTKQKSFSHFNRKSKNNKFEQKFNPQSLINNWDEQDKLWDEYQQKIWKPQQKNNNKIFENYKNKKQKQYNQQYNESQLDSILESRIEKGNKVLKKLASANLKFYL